MARRIDFADRRHGFARHPLALHGEICLLGAQRDAADLAGDTVTVDLLQQAIDRRRAIRRKPPPQSE